jgi:hypothetical protein
MENIIRTECESKDKADKIMPVEESSGADEITKAGDTPGDLLRTMINPEPKVKYRPTKLCQLPEKEKDNLKERMLIDGVVPSPSLYLTPVWGETATAHGQDVIEEYLHCLSEMLLSKDSGRMINKIMADMIKDAFRDRFDMYTKCCDSLNPSEIAKYSKLRTDQDRHLVFLIKTFKELNRPPLKVSIKSAESVNIGDTVDKQLNVSIAGEEGSN